MLLSHEEFFLHTVEELRNRINESTPYSIIRACGICRQLVADKNWLLKEANKNTQIKISFRILDYRGMFNLKVNIIWRNPYPASGEPKEVEKKEFLATPILRLKKHIYNIEDVIKIASNKMGGVHSDNPHKKNKKEIAFYDFDKAADLDHSATMNALKSICKIVLRTAEKVESAIKGHTYGL